MCTINIGRGNRMKKLSKKMTKWSAIGVMGVGLFASAGIASASNDNIGYSFAIKANYGNSYSAQRYRQTSDTSNQWKVNLNYSGEGTGTITTFWLDKAGTPVSNTHGVAQGSGAHYYNAISSANESYVRLGAENNNLSANTYTASGYWDEEIN